MEVVRPVESERERLGYIYLRAEHGLLTRLFEYFVALGAIMGLSLGGAYVFSNRLQRHVTGPVMEISAVARQVLRGDTHAVRAEKRSNDEVGDLVEAFNAMLAELGARADRLEESNSAKDRFLATLAHELRNPLAPIRTGLDILKKDPGNTARAERVRATMERQLTHMIHLIDDLLDIARVNTGKFNLDRRRVSLASIVEAAVEAYRPGIDLRAQILDVRLPEQEVWLHIDPVRMTQALGNLIGNASKYTLEGGNIWIEASADPQEGVVVTVRDNGVGIPAPSLAHVFDLFAQVRTSQDRSEGGLGIGLFLVRSVVELHGGQVSVASAGLGHGSEFRIRLPAAVILETAQAPETREVPETPEGLSPPGDSG
jgi:signal transduction histidine kinase